MSMVFLQLIEVDDLAARDARHGDDQIVGAIGQPSHAAVGHAEVRPTAVKAPEMMAISRIADHPRPEMERLSAGITE